MQGSKPLYGNIHCGKLNHDAPTYYRIIGFLEGYGRGRGHGRGRGDSNSPNSDSNTVGVSAQERDTFVPSLNDDQWNQVFSMWKSFNAKSSNDKMMGKITFQWLLDTDASFHKTGNRALLTDLHRIPTASVILPGGTHATTTQYEDGDWRG